MQRKTLPLVPGARPWGKLFGAGSMADLFIKRHAKVLIDTNNLVISLLGRFSWHLATLSLPTYPPVTLISGPACHPNGPSQIAELFACNLPGSASNCCSWFLRLDPSQPGAVRFAVCLVLVPAALAGPIQPCRPRRVGKLVPLHKGPGLLLAKRGRNSFNDALFCKWLTRGGTPRSGCAFPSS